MDANDDRSTSITREVNLELDAEQLWHSISTAEHLAQWLGDDVDLTVEAGAEGTITDDGVVRHVRVDEVVADRQLSFTWWDPTDRTTASRVVFEITGTETGSRLTIVETLPDPTTFRAEASQARTRWEVRVLSLWACSVAAALVL